RARWRAPRVPGRLQVDLCARRAGAGKAPARRPRRHPGRAARARTYPAPARPPRPPRGAGLGASGRRAPGAARVTRLAYLDCIGGLAGDMLLAALLDAGAPAEALRELPGRLGLAEVEIRVSRVERHGVGATHVDVVPPPRPPERTWRGMRQ